MKNYRGIIIENSVSDDVLRILNPYVVNVHYHRLDNKYDTNILIVLVPENQLLNILNRIKDNIKISYYAHFVFKNTMYVVFSNEICKLHRRDLDSIEFCKSRGRAHNIDNHLMKFEQMFEKDHPNE